MKRIKLMLAKALTVLVIEDNTTLLSVIIATLKKGKVEAFGVESGLEGIDFLNYNKHGFS